MAEETSEYDEMVSGLDDLPDSNPWPTGGDAFDAEGGAGMTVYGAGVNVYQGAGNNEDGKANVEQAVAGASVIAGQAVGAVTDPIGTLIANGLDFLIHAIVPLESALGMVTGNPELLDESIKRWSAVEQVSYLLAEEVKKVGDDMLLDWDDDAAAKAKEELATVADSIGSLGARTVTSQELITAVQFIATVLQELIKAVIAELIKFALMLFPAALAMAAVTFGGSVAAAISSFAGMLGKSVAMISKVLAKGAKLMGQISEALGKMSKVIGQTSKVLGSSVYGVASATANNQVPRMKENMNNAGDQPDGSDYESKGNDDIRDGLTR
ncbi:hypothetical protein [Salininema proteolyticum]|uniref:Uncharacterized protein n=1 Tax=Salininema proteolyticum TaxID=1607685 RepID=A0ABV8TUU9_9ACTN